MRCGRSRLCTSTPLHLYTSAPLHVYASRPLHPCTPAPPQVDTTSLRVLSAVPISPPTTRLASRGGAFQGVLASLAPKPSPPSSTPPPSTPPSSPRRIPRILTAGSLQDTVSSLLDPWLAQPKTSPAATDDDASSPMGSGSARSVPRCSSASASLLTNGRVQVQGGTSTRGGAGDAGGGTAPQPSEPPGTAWSEAEPLQAQLEALLSALNIPLARHAAVRRMPVDAQRLLVASWRQRELAERQRAATALARWTFVANAPRRRRLVRACREAALAHLRAEIVGLTAAGVPAEAIDRLTSQPLLDQAKQLRVLQGLLASGRQSI